MTHWLCSVVEKGEYQTATQTHHNYMQNNQVQVVPAKIPPMTFTLKLLHWHDRMGKVVDTMLSWVRDPTGI